MVAVIQPTEDMDFHPGLRVAYVAYCQLPVGQGRSTCDPQAPKMSQAQFIKLMQDVGVADPNGPVPVSAISIIFSAYKPQGTTRLLFPHFFKALGGVSEEAQVDVHRLVANLGSRTVDLQYLSSISVFPDKAYPYILTRGAGDPTAVTTATQRPASGQLSVREPSLSAPHPGLMSQRLRPSSAQPSPYASPATLRAAHIARHATVPYPGQGITREMQGMAPKAPTRAAWRAHDLAMQQDDVYLQSEPGVCVGPGLREHLAGPNPGSHRDSQREAVESEELFPANFLHLQQWGLWEPPRGPDGKVPGWLKHLLWRLDKLELEAQGAREHSHDVSASSMDAYATKEALKAQGDKLQDEIAKLKSAAAASNSTAKGVTDQLQQLQGSVEDLMTTTEQHSVKLKALHERQGSSRSQGADAAALAALEERVDAGMERVIGMLATATERVMTVSEETVPALEGAMTELASQLLELQTKLDKSTAEAAAAQAAMQASLDRVLDDASVDRTQLLTTTSLMDNYTGKTEQLKQLVTSLEKEVKALSGNNSLSNSKKLDAPQQLEQRLQQVEAQLKELAAEPPVRPAASATGELEQRLQVLEEQLQQLAEAGAGVNTIPGASPEQLKRLEKQMSGNVRDLKKQMQELAASHAPQSPDHSEAVEQLHSQLEAMQAQLKHMEAAGAAATAAAAVKAELEQKLAAYDSRLQDMEAAGAAAAAAEALKAQLEQRLVAHDARLKELDAAVRAAADAAAAAEAAVHESDRPPVSAPTVSFTHKLFKEAASKGDRAGGDAEAALELAAAVEDKVNSLERLVRGNSAALSALEAAQSNTSSRLAAVEDSQTSASSRLTATEDSQNSTSSRLAVMEEANTSVSGRVQALADDLAKATADLASMRDTSVSADSHPTASQLDAVKEQLAALEAAHQVVVNRVAALEAITWAADEAGPNTQQIEHEVASATAAALEALGITPETWGAARESIAALAGKMGALKDLEQATEEVQSDVLKFKLSFAGLKDLLDNHADRLEYLERDADNVKAAVERIRLFELNDKMKLMNGTAIDDTVASQAELSALTEKVQNMEDTLVQALVRMDSNIAQTAVRALQMRTGRAGSTNGAASTNGRVTADSDVDGTTGRNVRASIIGADGNIAGGTTDKSAIKTLNPNRDRLAAALLETDAKLTTVEELTQTLKAGQETMKKRLKELAEALVQLSNKAQQRLTRLESSTGFKDLGQKAAVVAEDQALASSGRITGDRRTSVMGDKRTSAAVTNQQVSPAHKALNQESSQLTAMNRILSKRIDDLEERLSKAEFKANAPRVSKLDSIHSAHFQGEIAKVFEEELRALGQELTDVQEMLQKSEDDLKQVIAEECVSQESFASFKERLADQMEQSNVSIQLLSQQVKQLANA